MWNLRKPLKLQYRLYLLKEYWERVGSAFSQLVNVIVLLGDRPNESISSRAYRLSGKKWSWTYTQLILDKVYGWLGEEEHCRRSYIADVVAANELLLEYERFYKDYREI